MVKLAPKGRKISRVLAESSTQDLRSHSVERKRNREHKQKWEPKWAHPGNPPATYDAPNGAQKPVVRLYNKSYSSTRQGQWYRDDRRRYLAQNKRPALKDDSGSWEEPPADDYLDQTDHESASVGEDVKYSYDAPAGPSAGEAILEIAVKKAVERFEDDQTAKLIHDEYEVLGSASEPEYDEGATITDEDEGFELV